MVLRRLEHVKSNLKAYLGSLRGGGTNKLIFAQTYIASKRVILSQILLKIEIV